jgi:acetyltransferase-like isoleucine patch superfamily enzyme
LNTIRLYVVQLLIRFIPVSRFFKIKYLLFRWAGIKLVKNVRIYSNVKVYGNGEIEIGEDTFIGHEVTLISSAPGKIKIGKKIDLGPRVFIGTGSHKLNPMGDRIAGEGVSNDIVLEDGVWIGANAILLPGVRIGEMSMIGAGSVVVNDIPSFTIAAGNPAKPIKKWDLHTNKWVRI